MSPLVSASLALRQAEFRLRPDGTRQVTCPDCFTTRTTRLRNEKVCMERRRCRSCAQRQRTGIRDPGAVNCKACGRFHCECHNRTTGVS